MDCQVCEWQEEFGTIGAAEIGCKAHSESFGCPLKEILGSRCLGWA
jgi:hypothetical protein